MKLPPAKLAPSNGSAFKDLKDGFDYIRKDESIVIFLAGRVVMGFFLMGMLSLIPAWAVKILGGDVTTNGMLYSARGVGALTGALMLAALSMKRVQGKIWLYSYLVMPVILFAFALTAQLWLSLVLIALIGVGIVTTNNACNAIIQINAPDDLRGRVMAFFVLMFQGSQPIGALLAGEMAEKFSEPAVAVVSAVAMMLYIGWVFLFKPKMRSIE